MGLYVRSVVTEVVFAEYVDDRHDQVTPEITCEQEL